MAKMVEFFVNSGKINGIQILSDSSLKRMERSGSMGELSKSEKFKGFGLSNETSYYKGFIYQGFAGSLPGGNAEIEYLPEYKLGYAAMINDGNEVALRKITYLIKYYQTKDFKQKLVNIDDKKYSITINPSGYYTSINAKIDKIQFIERIKNIQKVWVKNDTLFTKYMLRGNSTTKYVPTCNNEFRYEGYNVVGLSIINDPLDGQIIVSSGFLKNISPFWAYGLLTIFYAFFLILFTTTIFGFIWVLVYFFGKKKNKIALKICIGPLITSSFIFMAYFIIAMNSKTRYDWFQSFGTANIFSVLLLVCSIWYALASGWTVYYILKNRNETMSKFLYFHSAFAAILNFVVMLYLLSNGLIGIPTWV